MIQNPGQYVNQTALISLRNAKLVRFDKSRPQWLVDGIFIPYPPPPARGTLSKSTDGANRRVAAYEAAERIAP
jgi:hypothetical protein